MSETTRSLSRLLFLLRPLDHRLWLLVARGIVAAGIRHLGIAVGAAAIVVFVEFLCDVGLGLGLEVFVDGFVVLVGTTAGSTSAVVATNEVLVLEGGGEEGTGLWGLG